MPKMMKNIQSPFAAQALFDDAGGSGRPATISTNRRGEQRTRIATAVLPFRSKRVCASSGSSSVLDVEAEDGRGPRHWVCVAQLIRNILLAKAVLVGEVRDCVSSLKFCRDCAPTSLTAVGFALRQHVGHLRQRGMRVSGALEARSRCGLRSSSRSPLPKRVDALGGDLLVLFGGYFLQHLFLAAAGAQPAAPPARTGAIVGA